MKTKFNLYSDMDEQIYLLDEAENLWHVLNDYFDRIDDASLRDYKSVAREWERDNEMIRTLQCTLFDKLDYFRNWARKQVEDGYKEARKSDK